MLLIWTSRMLLRIVERDERGKNSCCVMAFSTVLTSCVFQLAPFAFCFYRKRMEVVCWDTLVLRRQRTCWPLTSFGHECGVMLSATSHGAPRAIKLSLDLIHMVFICLFLFLVRLGRIFRWILFWDCLGLRGGEIVFLWLLIVFLK